MMSLIFIGWFSQSRHKTTNKQHFSFYHSFLDPEIQRADSGPGTNSNAGNDPKSKIQLPTCLASFKNKIMALANLIPLLQLP